MAPASGLRRESLYAGQAGNGKESCPWTWGRMNWDLPRTPPTSSLGWAELLDKPASFTMELIAYLAFQDSASFRGDLGELEWLQAWGPPLANRGQEMGDQGTPCPGPSEHSKHMAVAASQCHWRGLLLPSACQRRGFGEKSSRLQGTAAILKMKGIPWQR